MIIQRILLNMNTFRSDLFESFVLFKVKTFKFICFIQIQRKGPFHFQILNSFYKIILPILPSIYLGKNIFY